MSNSWNGLIISNLAFGSKGYLDLWLKQLEVDSNLDWGTFECQLHWFTYLNKIRSSILACDLTYLLIIKKLIIIIVISSHKYLYNYEFDCCWMVVHVWKSKHLH